MRCPRSTESAVVVFPSSPFQATPTRGAEVNDGLKSLRRNRKARTSIGSHPRFEFHTNIKIVCSVGRQGVLRLSDSYCEFCDLLPPPESTSCSTKGRHMKLLIGLVVGLVFWSIPAIAQEKNDVGLVIGGTIVPSQSLTPGVSLIGPNGNVLPTRDLNFDASLALGAEYDHRIVSGNRTAIYAGIDFFSSPNDVQPSQRTLN